VAQGDPHLRGVVDADVERDRGHVNFTPATAASGDRIFA
jgi:hypothetical protein